MIMIRILCTKTLMSNGKGGQNEKLIGLFMISMIITIMKIITVLIILTLIIVTMTILTTLIILVITTTTRVLVTSHNSCITLVTRQHWQALDRQTRFIRKEFAAFTRVLKRLGSCLLGCLGVRQRRRDSHLPRARPSGRPDSRCRP